LKRPKDVPGTLLNIALLNLGSSDPNLRSAAYNLLCALAQTFDLRIDGQLLESNGLCIPSNNTIFIKSISEKLASKEPYLTLEFLEECIAGFRSSTIQLKHLCLEYMTPWLSNLTRFCRHNDENKRQKVAQILDKLISMTIEEDDMYPSIQAKIWSNIGSVSELLDMVLDAFIKRSASGGLGSLQAEILANTAVALASSKGSLVSRKVIGRLCRLIEKTCTSPTQTLEQHSMWNDIAILLRYLLMLSFNNSLDVVNHLAYLFHTVTLLVCTGPLMLRASVHGLVINIIHSLCTCQCPQFNEETHRILSLSLAEFSLAKFYTLFGISKVKSAAVTAFKTSRNTERSFAYSPAGGEQDRMPLASLETITDTLLEIMESCTKDMDKCEWLNVWTELARRFAFQFNPALQPRAIIVYGCISKNATESDIKQLLRMMVKALESHSDIDLIEAIVMCLTRLLPLLPAQSAIHKFMFWIAISILQLEDASLYVAGLALLEQNLHTLETHAILDSHPLEKIMMEAREPLEWQFKQLDQAVGLSFKSKFHFALVGHLIKGFRHPVQNTVARTIRLLHMLLGIVAKAEKRDKFQVTSTSAPYLAALVSVSEEVRCRCHLRFQTYNSTSAASSSNGKSATQNATTTASSSAGSGGKKTAASSLPASSANPGANLSNASLISTGTTTTGGTIYLMTQSPSNNSLMDEYSSSYSSGIKGGNSSTTLSQACSSSLTSPTSSSGVSIASNASGSLLASQQPKRQRSCDIIDSRAIILAKSNKQQQQPAQSPNQLQAQAGQIPQSQSQNINANAVSFSFFVF
jgi:neurofibromin 1